MVTMQNPEPASLFNGGKSADGSTEAHIAAFLERMDRLTAAVERSAAGAYQRRLTMSDIGNPAPIGLYAFAIATGNDVLATPVTGRDKIVSGTSRIARGTGAGRAFSS